MSSRPAEFKYTKEHEWLNNQSGLVLVGITDYAASELGDVAYVDLPEIGKKVTKGSSMFSVESVKAVSDIYSPVDGVIVAVNEELKNRPELINEDPFHAAWMVKIEATSDASEFLSSDEYNSYVSEISK